MNRTKKLIYFIIILFWLLGWFTSRFSKETSSQKTFQTDDSVLVTGHSSLIIRNWNDYNGTNYSLNYEILDSISNLSSKIKATFNYKGWRQLTYYEFWGLVYHHIYQNDSIHLIHIQDSLFKLKNVHHQDDRAFLNTVVSMVQDIPYTLILGYDTICGETINDKPCEDSITYGIHTPSKFLHSLRGDCDTRALLLYQILKNFGYQPMIMVSKHYRHAMLAVNIPSAGKYIEHLGNKFYFWETTAKGWQLGVLPPGVNKIENWDIALN